MVFTYDMLLTQSLDVYKKEVLIEENISFINWASIQTVYIILYQHLSYLKYLRLYDRFYFSKKTIIQIIKI